MVNFIVREQTRRNEQRRRGKKAKKQREKRITNEGGKGVGRGGREGVQVRGTGGNEKGKERARAI